MTAFPFSALVGQDDLREALLAVAVDPAIGGVLVRGERGTAKTTAVRGLAPLLDGPLVELPLGATADRVVGTLDLSRALGDGEAALRPGLLADADGGLLYVDEVNLLPDHLVDVLLDAAATGAVRVERDGLSGEYPARFLLVGTMNPEEGDLRPQLLDRFGLAVEVAGVADPAVRVEVVRRRLAFDADPVGFVARYAGEEAAVAARVADARARLAGVRLPDRMLLLIAGTCARLAVDGHRADIVCARAAVALAALDGAPEVDEDHVRRAARLALAHRRRRGPFEPAGLGEDELRGAMDGARGDGGPDPDGPGGGGSGLGGEGAGRADGGGNGSGEGGQAAGRAGVSAGGDGDGSGEGGQGAGRARVPAAGDGNGSGEGGQGAGRVGEDENGSGEGGHARVVAAGNGNGSGEGGKGAGRGRDVVDDERAYRAESPAASRRVVAPGDAVGSASLTELLRRPVGRAGAPGPASPSVDARPSASGDDLALPATVVAALVRRSVNDATSAPFERGASGGPMRPVGDATSGEEGRGASGGPVAASDAPRLRASDERSVSDATSAPLGRGASGGPMRSVGDATLGGEGRGASGGPLQAVDLREHVRAGRAGRLVVFCVDASGSMGARRRMAAVKGAVLSLLQEAYVRRDRVALVTFAGAGATVALPPTGSVERAADALTRLPTGGGTPIAAGLRATAELLVTERRRDPARRATAVVVTDGRAPAADRAAARHAAAELGRTAADVLVVDGEEGPVRLGLAAELAAAAGAALHPLSVLTAPTPRRHAA